MDSNATRLHDPLLIGCRFGLKNLQGTAENLPFAAQVNLLKFNPDGGAEAHARYGQEAGRFLAKAGANVRYLGHVAATVIGDEAWDEVILVEYPSKAAFYEMTQNPDYPGGMRAGALLDARLYCSQEVSR